MSDGSIIDRILATIWTDEKERRQAKKYIFIAFIISIAALIALGGGFLAYYYYYKSATNADAPPSKQQETSPLEMTQTDAPSPLPIVEQQETRPLEMTQTDAPSPLPIVEQQETSPLEMAQTHTPSPLPPGKQRETSPLEMTQTDAPSPLPPGKQQKTSPSKTAAEVAATITKSPSPKLDVVATNVSQENTQQQKCEQVTKRIADLKKLILSKDYSIESGAFEERVQNIKDYIIAVIQNRFKCRQLSDEIFHMTLSSKLLWPSADKLNISLYSAPSNPVNEQIKQYENSTDDDKKLAYLRILALLRSVGQNGVNLLPLIKNTMKTVTSETDAHYILNDTQRLTHLIAKLYGTIDKTKWMSVCDAVGNVSDRNTWIDKCKIKIVEPLA